MLRLVLDTNILISALLRKNTPPYQLYEAWRTGGFELVTSHEQLAEFQRVIAYEKLQRYFTPAEAQEMQAGIFAFAEFAYNLPVVSYSQDADDNVILATAIAGAADYLVTGDKRDLLSLGRVERVSIVSVRQVLDIL